LGSAAVKLFTHMCL